MVYSLYNYNMYIHKSYICTYINGLQGFFFYNSYFTKQKDHNKLPYQSIFDSRRKCRLSARGIFSLDIREFLNNP